MFLTKITNTSILNLKMQASSTVFEGSDVRARLFLLYKPDTLNYIFFMLATKPPQAKKGLPLAKAGRGKQVKRRKQMEQKEPVREKVYSTPTEISDRTFMTIIFSVIMGFIAVIMGFMAIMFFQLKADINQTRSELKADINRVEDRINRLEVKVDSNHKELRQDIKENRESIQQINQKLDRLLRK